ncbi:MAG: hypothetical protein IJ538_05015 [Clostridia bacterium]|nr:hypothetical protein [Clostridia bacterium]
MKKNNKKYVIVSQKLYPSQINELSMCCFIVHDDKLDDSLDFILNNGGRVIAAVPCAGLARNSILRMVDGYIYNNYFILAMCQTEITDILMLDFVKHFELDKPGKGKAFVIDILGYMGAKGPFVE